MKYKSFKNFLDGREISAVGFGCWATGGTWNNSEDEKSIEAIRSAIENGVNFFDVAPIYGKGHAEKILGQAIKGYDRSKLIIATKCGFVWDENLKSRQTLAKEDIKYEVEESLKRLDIEYIDLYQCHWPDTNTPIEESMEALLELKKEGKIKAIGLSNFSVNEWDSANKVGDISSFQGLYNMLERNPEAYHNIPLDYRVADEILPLCKEMDIPFLPYSPIMQGLLTGTFKKHGNFDSTDNRHKNPKLFGEGYEKYYEITEELKEIANKIEKPLSQLAINWLIEQNEVGPVICGAQTKEQILENIKSTDWSLTEETKGEIEEILKKHKL